jgi:ketosteroid isomerase-like protein
MLQSDAAEIATKCLEAWSTGDFDTARSLLRDDVTFVGPLGAAGGVEACMNGLVDLAKNVKSAEPKKVLVDGDDVCIMYDLVTLSAGTVPTSGWYHVENGKIDSVRAYFDARQLSPASDVPSSPAPTRPREVGGAVIPIALPALVSAEMELAEWSS